MEKRVFFKALCLMAVPIIVLSALGFSSSADDETLCNNITPIATIAATDNDAITWFDGYDHGVIPNINAVQNPDGTYCLCVVMDDGSLSIIELNSDYSVKKSFAVPLQLSTFAAFCKGNDGTYYVLFAQPLTVDNRYGTALKIVNIGTDGKTIRSLEFSGMASGSWLGVAEINCGNNAMITNDKYLTGYIARDMFPVKTNPITGKDEFTANGQVHQSSYAFAIDLNTFKQVEVEHMSEIPYASHSFHQYIIEDGNDFVYVDRGDALPKRSYHITKMSGGTQWRKLAQGDSFIFKGEYADNHTYGQFGGFMRCGNKYMLTGSYQNTTDSTEQTSANIFVQMFDAKTLAAEPQFYLTDYTGDDTVINPKAVRVDDDYIAFPYMLCNNQLNTKEIHILLADNSGEVAWDKAVTGDGADAVLPRYGQVFYDSTSSSIVWFTIVDGKLNANSVAFELPESEETTEPTGEVTTSPETPPSPDGTTDITSSVTDKETTLPDITVSPSAPETTTPSQEPSGGEVTIWQRIVNFFVGIWNFFISLFN